MTAETKPAEGRIKPSLELVMAQIFAERIRSGAPQEEIKAAGEALTYHINNQKTHGIAGE